MSLLVLTSVWGYGQDGPQVKTGITCIPTLVRPLLQHPPFPRYPIKFCIRNIMLAVNLFLYYWYFVLLEKINTPLYSTLSTSEAKKRLMLHRVDSSLLFPSYASKALLYMTQADVLSLDVLSHRMFCPRTLCLRTFCLLTFCHWVHAEGRWRGGTPLLRNQRKGARSSSAGSLELDCAWAKKKQEHPKFKKN